MTTFLWIWVPVCIYLILGAGVRLRDLRMWELSNMHLPLRTRWKIVAGGFLLWPFWNPIKS